MTAEKLPSKNQIKREAGRLARDPNWNPERVLANRDSALDALQRESRTARTEALYQENESCTECSAEQALTGDETALCTVHLEALMDL